MKINLLVSSTRLDLPLKLELKPSRLLAGLLVLGHATALVSLLPLSLSPGVVFVLSMLIIVSLVASLRKTALLTADAAVVRLVWRGGDEWRLWEAGSSPRVYRLSGTRFTHPWLTVLNLVSEDGRDHRSVTIMADSLDPTTSRQLRARLLFASSRS